MAKVPPCKEVIISKFILFWRRAFLNRDISVFSKETLCQLSLCSVKRHLLGEFSKDFYVCYSVLQTNRGNRDGQMINQWEAELAHLASRRGTLVIFAAMRWILPCAQGKPRVKAMAKDLCHKTIGSHSGLPNKHLGGMTSQCQTSCYPWLGQNDYRVPVLSIPHSWYNLVGSILSNFSVLNTGVCMCSNVHRPGWARRTHPKSEHSHPGSDGTFRTLPVSIVMSFLCSLIDRKRKPMHRVIESMCCRPGFWISLCNIRYLKSTSPYLFFLNVLL